MPQPRRLHDRFFKQAKAEGFAARSAYKLLEIQDRKRVLRRSNRVLDLGCAPGSWVQVASEIVGPGGLIVGVDLKPVTIHTPANARTIVGDVFKLTAESLGEHTGGARFDAVLSDMAPNTEGGGGGTVDHFRSIDLCRKVLEVCATVLKPGGSLVMKVFEGEAYPELLKDAGRLFEEAKGMKPEASRDVSREMFVVGLKYRGPKVAAALPVEGAKTAGRAPEPRPGWGERA